MKNALVLCALFIALLLKSGFIESRQVSNSQVPTAVQDSIRQLNQQWAQGLVKKDLAAVVALYATNAIYMPEYQPTLNGTEQIKDYFATLAERREVVNMQFNTEEMIDLSGYVLEIGRFDNVTVWSTLNDGKRHNYQGKYWRIFQIDETQAIKIIGEAFGFFMDIEHPQLWVTDRTTRTGLAPSGFKPADASIELKAYHALGQKGVKQKNGILRSQLYSDDAIFYPFADTAKQGIEVLRPYFIKYSSHDAIIDYVQTHTHEVLYLDHYILEFAKFNVAWHFNDLPGQSNGKGISLRKRLTNGELRFFRHIATHNVVD